MVSKILLRNRVRNLGSQFKQSRAYIKKLKEVGCDENILADAWIQDGIIQGQIRAYEKILGEM